MLKNVLYLVGPADGTFQDVANAIELYKPVKEMADFTVKV